jgi:hypothetical protein
MGPRKGMASALAALLAVGAMACSSDLDTDLWSFYRDQLTEGRALWSQHAGAAYTMRYEEYCSCGTDVGPVFIEVDATGAITAITDAVSGEAMPEAEWSDAWTVEGLFDRLDEAISQRVASYEARYDGTDGYPTSAAIDYEHATSGDEVNFRITQVTWPGG